VSLLFERRVANLQNAETILAGVRAARISGSPGYSAQAALEVAAVTACVGLRAGAFAQLPLKAYRDVAGVPQALDPQPELLRTPSDLVVPSAWKIQMSLSRDLWGFALGRMSAFDAAMYPKRVEWVDPSIVSPLFDGRSLDWRIQGEVYDGSLFVYVPSRWVLPGTPIGMPPLAHSGLVELSKRAQEFGRDWFRNGAVPSSIIYSDKDLGDDGSDKLLARIKERWSERQPAVLGSGLKYEKVSIAANESQFLETLRQVDAQIAVSFNMPPEKIAAAISGQSVTYANREQNQEQYLVDSINPDLVVIQESLDRYSPRPQYCRFSTGAFLRSDLLTRYQSYEIGIRSQFMTPNEARRFEEWGPIDSPTPSPATPPGGGAS
jgi:HK97 family phage portal protein